MVASGVKLPFGAESILAEEVVQPAVQLRVEAIIAVLVRPLCEALQDLLDVLSRCPSRCHSAPTSLPVWFREVARRRHNRASRLVSCRRRGIVPLRGRNRGASGGLYEPAAPGDAAGRRVHSSHYG